MKKKISILVIAVLILLPVFNFVRYVTWSEEYVYDLQQIDSDENYVVYYTISSTVPADNYEVVYVCYENIMHTLKGNVTINYTSEEPYIHIKDINVVNEDEYDLYVPKGTVIYEDGVGTR